MEAVDKMRAKQEMADANADADAAHTEGNINININSDSAEANGSKPKLYPKGWKLHTLTAGLCLSMLLSTLETTIVSTSLVSMVNELQGFGQAGWVIAAYFLTCTRFLVIYAKLSDILGTKLLILFAVALFAVFSEACGFASSMLQL